MWIVFFFFNLILSFWQQIQERKHKVLFICLLIGFSLSFLWIHCCRVSKTFVPACTEKKKLFTLAACWALVCSKSSFIAEGSHFSSNSFWMSISALRWSSSLICSVFRAMPNWRLSFAFLQARVCSGSD